MATESSGFWTTGTSGDGASTYTQTNMSTFMAVLAACHGFEGVAPNYLNELAGTVPGANTARINTGGAVVDGKAYHNSATVDVTIANAGAGETRIDRIVLRADWSAYTVRIYLIAGVSGVAPVAPAITQTSGTTYDIMLYQALVTAAGVVTLTDERTLANMTAAKSADRTRMFLVQPAFQALDARGATMGNGADVTRYGFFRLPTDWAAGGTVAAVLLPTATGNAYISNTIYHGAAGENYTAHTDTQAISAIAVVTNQIILVKTVTLSNVSQADYYFCAFRRHALDASDTSEGDAYLVGWLVSYTADS